MSCIYNKVLTLQVRSESGTEERKLNLIIINNDETLHIKIRDTSQYIFNYTEAIDLADYEVIRFKQNLDINFIEFKSNLLELLQQILKKEMFLKCEANDRLCTLTFYNKSKIKSIIYLTLDLHATDQKDILNEVVNNLHFMKESNERLQLQVTNMKKAISDKEIEFNHLNFHKIRLQAEFYDVLKEIEKRIMMKSQDVEYFLLRKITNITEKLNSLLNKVDTLKDQAAVKNDFSSKLLQNIDNLSMENNKRISLIEKLKQENNILQVSKINLEKKLAHLTETFNERDTLNKELQKKNEELRNDMEKATIIISQKKAAIGELSRDLVQANQLLVNFNNHYDSKVKAVEDLQMAIFTKNQFIEDEKRKHCHLKEEFEGYKMAFNSETQEQLKHKLFVAQSKMEELEKNIRKVNKINALLSEKVNKVGI